MIRVREKNFILRMKGGTYDMKFSLKKHEKMREKCDKIVKMGNILSKT